jgi:hypothetical protein
MQRKLIWQPGLLFGGKGRAENLLANLHLDHVRILLQIALEF